MRTKRAARVRLDQLILERGLAESRARAQALLIGGRVRVGDGDGARFDRKPGDLVDPETAIEVAAPDPYVSRGGHKLAAALDAFRLDPSGAVCLDVGASTGGFTDVLLSRGAARVYAVDVGRGQLAWTLRADPRVVVMERTNIRRLQSLPERVDGSVIDVSFISLRLVLPAVARLLKDGAWVVALVKPQFEAGRAEADRGGGVIVDPAVHRAVLGGLLEWIDAWPGESGARLTALGLAQSPITGREGNREYLLYLRRASTAVIERPLDIGQVDAVVRQAFHRS